MTEKLKKELPAMLEEHKKIVSGLNNLIEIAKRENREEHVEFADALLWHAKAEEELLYPAAILVGEYLKLKTSPRLTLT